MSSMQPTSCTIPERTSHSTWEVMDHTSYLETCAYPFSFFRVCYSHSSPSLSFLMLLSLGEYYVVATTYIGDRTTSFSVPEEIRGDIATGFKFTVVNGSLTCNETRTYYWGCSQGLNLFIVSPPVNSSSRILLPGMLDVV